MATKLGIERYIPTETLPTEDVTLPTDKIEKASLQVGRNIIHYATADFPLSDPWSKKMRGVIAGVSKEGLFRGQTVTELGIGDGRNERVVGEDIKEVVGVDVEAWRLQLAGYNLATGPHKMGVPVELWRADAVEFLGNLKETGRDRLSGRVLMCLPQSPEGANATDRYNGSVSLNEFRTDYDKFGLSLNAATLNKLRNVADRRLIAFAIISGRVPEEASDEMFVRMGWEIQRKFRTGEPVQQDPTTGTSWVTHIDDGRRFFEKVTGGVFIPIPAVEAENRRLASKGSRSGLNVYHHLTVYQVRPDGKE